MILSKLKVAATKSIYRTCVMSLPIGLLYFPTPLQRQNFQSAAIHDTYTYAVTVLDLRGVYATADENCAFNAVSAVGISRNEVQDTATAVNCVEVFGNGEQQVVL